MNRTYFLLALLVAVGGFLRFHALERQSLWDDEMSTLVGIHTPTLRDEIVHHRNRETHPPLFFFQLRLWKTFFGDSLGTLRANSALWGTASLVLIFLLGRLYGGNAAGLTAAAFLALSPFHLAYSQELRPYALSLFLVLAGLLSLERLLRREKGALLLALFWTLQLYTHYWQAFVCAVLGLYGVVAASSGAIRRKILLAGAGALCLFGFWLPVLFAQFKVIGGLSFWMPSASVMNLIKTFVAFSGLYFNVASSTFTAPGPRALLVVLGAGLLGLALIGIRRAPGALLWWIGPGLLLPWVLSYKFWGLFLWYRYTIHMYPPFVLLVVLGALSFRSTWLRATAVTLALGSQALGTSYYATGWQKANSLDVVRYTESLANPQTVVIRPAYFASLFDFYDQGRLTALDQHSLDSPQKREALHGHPIVFIAFEVPSDPVGEALRQRYPVLSQREFPGFAHLGITVYQLDSRAKAGG